MVAVQHHDCTCAHTLTLSTHIQHGLCSCAAFDFPTKGILNEAAKRTQYWRLRDSSGKAPGLIGWWPSQAVTFVDNHDTGSSQQHWCVLGAMRSWGQLPGVAGQRRFGPKHCMTGVASCGAPAVGIMLLLLIVLAHLGAPPWRQRRPFPRELVGLGYAYILTHPGIPCVFCEHMTDWGAPLRDTIKQLIQVSLVGLKRRVVVSRAVLSALDTRLWDVEPRVAGNTR